MDHDCDPIDREKEESEAGSAGGDQECGADRQRRSDKYQQHADDPITFVDVSKAWDHAERDGHKVARLSFGGFQQPAGGRWRLERLFA